MSTRLTAVSWPIRVLMACAALVAGTCGAAESYPARAIRLIVPGPPGTGVDVDARVVAQKMAEVMRASIVIDNVPAAGGIVAMDATRKAAPDGYTMAIAGIGPLAAFPYLHKTLPYDAERDFVPVSLLQILSSIIVVHRSSGITSVQDLIVRAAEAPGKLTFASQGYGTFVHLAGEYFMLLTGAKLTHVPYGAKNPIPDIVGGHVNMMFTGVAPVIGAVRAGELKILAVSSRARLEILPDVPTFAEAGLPAYDAGAWIGLIVPRGTTAEIVAQLNAAAVKAVNSTDAKARMTAFGNTPVGSTSVEFEAFIRAEQGRWSKVIRDANVKLN